MGIAEVNLRELIRLRSEHPDMGINHVETIITYKYLERVLRRQGKVKDADEILLIINEYKMSKNDVETSKTCPIENDSNPCCTNVLKSTNLCNNIIYEDKNEYIQRNEVIMDSYRTWKQVRKEQFNELYNEDGIPEKPIIVVRNEVSDCPSSEKQWRENIMT